MEKTMEALRHTQAKCSELEKGNKKLVEQAHVDQREIIRLKEELQGSKAKVGGCVYTHILVWLGKKWVLGLGCLFRSPGTLEAKKEKYSRPSIIRT